MSQFSENLDDLPHLEAESPSAATHRSAEAPAPASGRAAYAGADKEDVHLTEYLRVLHKRRWTAATAFVLVFGTAVIYTFTATPIYEAKVQILIESENPNVVKFEEVLELNKSTADYYQTQYRILQSRALARRTLEATKFWNHPLFVARKTGLAAVASNAKEWVSGRAGYSTAELPGAGETAAQSKAIDEFLERLTVSPIRNSRLVDVRFATPDAQLSALVANALARAYIEQSLEFKFTATKEASDFLSRHMTEQRSKVEASEQALQRYREQNDALSLEDRQNIVVQRLADLNAALTKVRTERIQKESLHQQVQTIQSDRAALDTFPAILSNVLIQQLKVELAGLQRQQAEMGEKLGDRHPGMVKIRSAIESGELRLQAEIAKVVQSVRNDYLAAVTQERSLAASLDQQKQEALGLNRRAIDYGALQRDAAANRQIFEGLLQRTRETDISSELRTSNIRVVDQAEVPSEPASPRKLLNIFLALFGGGFLGISLAMFFEYVDSRIKGPDEIRNHLGLPLLGMVPAVDSKKDAGAPLVNNGVPPQFAEAFRAIRTNVLFSSADAGSKSIVVTSTAPGEGKTLVSANLALSLAFAGQRVLLIDADMRRPKVHELFGIAQEPGLSNVLVGNVKASEAVLQTEAPNLWVMAAGKHPPNPAELLGSVRFKEFLKSLGDHFAWVVLDSPPVMAVTDASVISHVATGVVFVVGAEMTSAGAAKAALGQLDAAKARYVGGILNRVDVQRNSYYYAHYYRREYAEYYQDAART